MNLADSLTKSTYESFKTFSCFSNKKSWVVRFHEEFVSARKQQKLRKQKQLEDAKCLLPALQEWPEENPMVLEQTDFGISSLFPNRV